MLWLVRCCAQRLEVDVVVELEADLVVMTGLVGGSLSKHIDDALAIAVPELVAQCVEELNDGVRFFGRPVRVHSSDFHAHVQCSLLGLCGSL